MHLRKFPDYTWRDSNDCQRVHLAASDNPPKRLSVRCAWILSIWGREKRGVHIANIPIFRLFRRVRLRLGPTPRSRAKVARAARPWLAELGNVECSPSASARAKRSFRISGLVSLRDCLYRRTTADSCGVPHGMGRLPMPLNAVLPTSTRQTRWLTAPATLVGDTGRRRVMRFPPNSAT